jgi:hypothetical protein
MKSHYNSPIPIFPIIMFFLFGFTRFSLIYLLCLCCFNLAQKSSLQAPISFSSFSFFTNSTAFCSPLNLRILPNFRLIFSLFYFQIKSMYFFHSRTAFAFVIIANKLFQKFHKCFHCYFLSPKLPIIPLLLLLRSPTHSHACLLLYFSPLFYNSACFFTTLFPQY